MVSVHPYLQQAAPRRTYRAMGTHIWVVAALLAGAAATTPASEVAALRDFYGALGRGGDGWPDTVAVRRVTSPDEQERSDHSKQSE